MNIIKSKIFIITVTAVLVCAVAFALIWSGRNAPAPGNAPQPQSVTNGADTPGDSTETPDGTAAPDGGEKQNATDAPAAQRNEIKFSIIGLNGAEMVPEFTMNHMADMSVLSLLRMTAMLKEL